MANTSAASVGGSGEEPSVTASAIVAHAAGSHILRIDGYSHTKGLGNGKCITSEKFVIGGHRWYLQYYPGGASLSSSDWISIYLRLGYTNDDEEVKAKFTMSLLDHDGHMVSSYSRTSSPLCSFSGEGVNASCGFNEFIRRSILEESAYLKGDVFSIKCDVAVATKEISTKSIPVPAVRRVV